MDGRKNNGGARPGAGRPVTGQRGIHQIRAYEDEWVLIQRFIKCVRTDKQIPDIHLSVMEDELKLR